MEIGILVLVLIIDIGVTAAAIATGVIGLTKKNLGCAIASTVLGGIAILLIFFVSWLVFIAGVVGLSLGIPGIVLSVKNRNKELVK